MTAKVCLVMIVRDESAIIRERLEAVRDEVDAFHIVDTGSVDDTVEIVRDVMLSRLGNVWSHHWAGFADARTYAVARATEWAAKRTNQGEWWALLLDADTVAHFEPGWRKALVGDVVECALHHGALRYSHPRLLRLGAHAWTWRGVVHEYLVVPGALQSTGTDLVWVEHGSGGARERKGPLVKFREDAELIAKTRAEGTEPDLDARYCFYEAQSWRDCGELDRAIDLYMERGRMGGWHGETYIAWLRAGELVWQSKENWPGAFACWVAAWAADPSRAEALIGLASLCRVRQLWAPAFEHGRLAQVAVKNGVQGLFADTNILWRADLEVAIAGSWVGTAAAKLAGRQAALRLVNLPMVPTNIKAQMKQALTDFYPRPKAKR